jgi:hypothetical protein
LAFVLGLPWVPGAAAGAQADALNEYGLSKAAFTALLPSARRVVRNHYMSTPAPGATCTDVSIEDYAGLPTKRCQYRQGKLSAEVVLVDPDETQLTRWVLATCESFDLAGPKPNIDFQVRCGRKLMNRIRIHSHGHFPVAGIVIRGGRASAFRHGVLAVIPGIQNGTKAQPTTDQIESAIAGPVTGWGEEALPQGTTYADYVRFGRLTSVEGTLIDDSASTFPQLVGARFRNEWGNNFNSLMRAWACANAKSLGIAGASCVEIPADAPGAARRRP